MVNQSINNLSIDQSIKQSINLSNHLLINHSISSINLSIIDQSINQETIRTISAMFGLLCASGLTLKTIAIFTLFLVLGLGVDDSFLMLHSLRSKLSQNNKGGITVLMAETMQLV